MDEGGAGCEASATMTERSRTLTGKIARERIRLFEVPRFSREMIDAYLALTDLTATLSDAMDEIGIAGAVPAAILGPTLPERRIAGPALTVRNIALVNSPTSDARQRISRQADIEAHNLASPGDVLVIEGVAGVSSLGGNSATLGHRQGEAGAIVDGGTRDTATSRAIGFPIWSRGATPLTGKWRLETVAINGPVHIAGVTVNVGDLVVADENGVCFVPRDKAGFILARAQQLSAGENERSRDVAAGVSIVDIARKRYFAPVA